MTRPQALQSAARWFDQGEYLALMKRRVAIPSASDTGQPNDALLDYLEGEMVPALTALGFSCEIFPNPLPGNAPILLAERIESADAPTLLSYGHGDVISGQDAQWRAGLSPWTLTVEGDRWYGRGTADNKGQHTVNLAALSQVLQARAGRLGFNLKLILEMGEETGSPGLREFCEQQKDRLSADLFVASDGPRVHAQKPTVFLGSRGIANFTLSLKSRDRAFHSGNWGGVLANPATIVSHAVASLVDAQGRMKVAGLMPPPLLPKLREALADVEIGGDANDPALDEGWGEPGLTPAERLIGWNTIEVLAMGAGNPERPIGAIPPRAVAHCQLRFVPGTDWTRLAEIVRAHLDQHGFEQVEVEVVAATPATRLDLDSPWVRWTLDSIEASTGKKPTLLPNLAGSLPNDVFADLLGLPTVWVPHSYPACSQHAPNEHLLAPVMREGLLLMTGLLWDLGERGGERPAPWPVRLAAASVAEAAA